MLHDNKYYGDRARRKIRSVMERVAFGQVREGLPEDVIFGQSLGRGKKTSVCKAYGVRGGQDGVKIRMGMGGDHAAAQGP